MCPNIPQGIASYGAKLLEIKIYAKSAKNEKRPMAIWMWIKPVVLQARLFPGWKKN